MGAGPGWSRTATGDDAGAGAGESAVRCAAFRRRAGSGAAARVACGVNLAAYPSTRSIGRRPGKARGPRSPPRAPGSASENSGLSPPIRPGAAVPAARRSPRAASSVRPVMPPPPRRSACPRRRRGPAKRALSSRPRSPRAVPARIVGKVSPRPNARPREKLRLAGPVQVSNKSPSPDNPITVSARPPKATVRRASSARPRVISAARAFSPSPAPVTAPAAMAMTFFAAPPTCAPIGSSLPYSRKDGVARRRHHRLPHRPDPGWRRPRRQADRRRFRARNWDRSARRRSLPAAPRRRFPAAGVTFRSRCPLAQITSSVAHWPAAAAPPRNAWVGTAAITVPGSADRSPVTRTCSGRRWPGSRGDSLARRDDLRLAARPQHDIVAGAGGLDRQRDAPGAGAEDGDFTHRPAA